MNIITRSAGGPPGWGLPYLRGRRGALPELRRARRTRPGPGRPANCSCVLRAHMGQNQALNQHIQMIKPHFDMWTMLIARSSPYFCE